MRKSRFVWVVLQLGVPFLVAGVALMTWRTAVSDKFIAHCSFVIDWTRMPSVPNDPQAKKLHDEVRKGMIESFTRVQRSETDIENIVAGAQKRCPQCEITHPAVRNSVRIECVTEGDSDVFTIVVTGRGSNSVKSVAEATISYQMQQARSVGDIAKVGAFLRGVADADELAQRQKQLTGEDSRSQRDDLEWQRFQNAMGMVFNSVTDVSEAVRVKNPIIIETRNFSSAAIGIAVFGAVVLGTLVRRERLKRAASFNDATPRRLPHQTSRIGPKDE